MKKSFILHIDSLAVVPELTTEQQAELFLAIYNYHIGIEKPLSKIVKIAFIPLKNQFDRDQKKYNSICERNKKNGKKGGRPKKQTDTKNPKNPVAFLETQNNPKNPSKPDNDNKKKKVNKKETENLIFKEFENFFSEKLISVYKEFLQFRKEKKKAITVTQENRFIKKLQKLSNNNSGVAEKILIQSIENGWIGIFEMKQKESTIPNIGNIAGLVLTETEIKAGVKISNNNYILPSGEKYRVENLRRFENNKRAVCNGKFINFK